MWWSLLMQFLVGTAAITLPTLIRRLLWAFGIGAVVFTGLNVLYNQLSNLALAQFSGIAGLPLQVIGILNIDVAFSMILSAYSIKMTMKFLGGISPKQMRLF